MGFRWRSGGVYIIFLMISNAAWITKEGFFPTSFDHVDFGLINSFFFILSLFFFQFNPLPPLLASLHRPHTLTNTHRLLLLSQTLSLLVITLLHDIKMEEEEEEASTEPLDHWYPVLCDIVPPSPDCPLGAPTDCFNKTMCDIDPWSFLSTDEKGSEQQLWCLRWFFNRNMWTQPPYGVFVFWGNSTQKGNMAVVLSQPKPTGEILFFLPFYTNAYYRAIYFHQKRWKVRLGSM